jgi:hypothetical protein
MFGLVGDDDGKQIMRWTERLAGMSCRVIGPERVAAAAAAARCCCQSKTLLMQHLMVEETTVSVQHLMSHAKVASHSLSLSLLLSHWYESKTETNEIFKQ